MIKNNSILKINIKNIINNYKFFKSIKKNIIVAPTIKANAYGLGDKVIFNLLKKNKCEHFFVATLEEGINLKNKNKKISIYILNGIQNYSLKLFSENNLIPIINTLPELKKIIKTDIKFGLHIDTGINRLGIERNLINKEIFKSKNLKILISHLASADNVNNIYNEFQKNNFEKILENVDNKNMKFSLSNSNGSVLSNSYVYDLIRPGIGLYGGHNGNKLLSSKIKHVLTLSGKIIQIKHLNKNEFVGYNQTYKSTKKIKIAIIGIGYADGIPRLLSNKGVVYFKDEKYRIIGRVSMDSITIDISKSKHKLKIGSYVDIFNKNYGIENFANQCSTISNEVITSIGQRVKRVYV